MDGATRDMINLAFIAYLIGLLLSGLAVAMLATALVEWWLDAEIWIGFFTSGVVTGFVALALVLTTRRTTTTRLTLRSAFLFTVLSWTVASLFAALPLELAVGTITFTDAVFEAVSGLTTTGSTVLSDLEREPRGILFWRSMLHWLGGIGIIATAIVLLPMLRVGGMQVFRAESSERSDQLMGRPGEVGGAILAIYTLLTGLCALGYRWGGMSGFDAVNHAMSTVSTGGFSAYDASFAAFDDPFLELVAVAFMMAGALPFLAYVRSLWGRGRPLWRDSQVLAFVLTMALASLVAWVLVLAAVAEPAGRAFARAAFNVVSIATTTGFASGDFQTWGPSPRRSSFC